MSGYDIAQICINGHCTNSDSEKYPQFNQNYCEKCGETTITKCQECNTPIRGNYHYDGIVSCESYTPPDFCYHCGKSFPWLSKKMKAAVELAQLEEVLTEEESAQFSEYVTDISKNTPSSPVSAKKIAIMLKKFRQSAALEIRA